jgi:hypothetical protein
MDKLNQEQLAKVKKMSDLRIRSTLLNAGQDEAVVGNLNREQLLNAMAEHMIAKKPEAAAPAIVAPPMAGLGTEQFQMWLELEARDRQARLEIETRKLENEARDRQARLEFEEKARQVQLEFEERARRQQLEIQERARQEQLAFEKEKMDREE